MQIILTEGNLSLCSSSISAQMHEVELDNVDVVAEAPLECSYCGQKYLRENEDAHIEACPEYPVTCEKCGAGGYTRSTIKNHTCPSQTPPDGGGGGGGGGVTPTPTPGPGGGGGGRGGGGITPPKSPYKLIQFRTSYVKVTFSDKSDNPINVKLNAFLQKILEKAKAKGIFSINVSCTSNHPSNASRSAHSVNNGSRGIDINYINGIHVGDNNETRLLQDIIQSTEGWLENYGPHIIEKNQNGSVIQAPWARTIKGGHYDHVHISVSK